MCTTLTKLMRVCRIFIFVLPLLAFISCARPQESESPTTVLRAYIEAYNNRDIAGLKKTFSKQTIKMYEKSAEKNQTSIDDVVKGQFEHAPADKITLSVETGAEKIAGDSATVEIRDNAEAKWETMPLVREEGVWKIALDRYVIQIMNRKSG